VQSNPFSQEEAVAVKVEIFARNMEVTETIRDYVLKRASKLDRYLNRMDEVRVDLAYVKSARSANDRMVAQITIRARRAILRTEERADDLLAAFDTAIEKMQRQLDRYKGKHHRGRGDGRSAAEVAIPMPQEIAEAEIPAIVRRKQIKVTPMKEADALEQMRMLGHDNFFVFFDVETNAITVLYRRRDGTYGVIETNMG
jgi:putative sigma-54 modulation protein